MIISPEKHKTDKGARSERLILFSLFFIFILLSLFVFSGYNQKASPATQQGVVYCDAENVKGDKFVQGGEKFSGGNWQSQEKAHSGNFSCKFPKGDGPQFGLSYKFRAPIAGQLFKATVWRYKPAVPEGKLVVQGKAEGGKGFQYEEVDPIIKGEDGWEQIEIRFHIPVNQNLESINLYVYTDGRQEVYFDDLKLEKLADWPIEKDRLEILDLKVGPKAMGKLEQKREEAIRLGILEAEEEDWVNAEIVRPDSAAIPVKMRLKGDWLDHLEGDKWSFRVKVKDPYHWNRLKVFSLHTPAARYFLHEWLLHRFWEKEGVLTTRYDFVQLRINGRSYGIYAYEEHFEKQLVEFSERREGPIVKFSEEGYWAAIGRQYAHHGYVRFGTQHAAMDARNSDVAPFEEKDTKESPLLSEQFARAQILMEDYRSGVKPPSEVFDLDRLAKYYAISDLFNAYHGLVWHNQRYYYNPVIDRLEPIGFDGFGTGTDFKYTFLGEGALNPAKLVDKSFYVQLFMDPDFVAKYLQYLYRFSERTYLTAFFDEIYPEWLPRLQSIQLEFDYYQPSLKKLVEQADFVRSLLMPFNDQSLKAYPGKASQGQKQIIVTNTHTLPLEVIGYGLNAQVPANMFSDPLLLPGHTTRHLQSQLRRDPSIQNFSAIRFLEEVALKQQALTRYDTLLVPSNATYIFYRLLGFDSLFHSRIAAWSQAPEVVLDSRAKITGALRSNALYEVAGTVVTFHPGNHRLDSLLIIPAGYELFIDSGTAIDLVAGGAIVSHSPAQVLGTEELPIKIYSSDGKGGGFHLLQTADASTFKYVIFDNLNTLDHAGWTLTGAVTCYEADADFYRCVFRNNHCEDALNMVRSQFMLASCQLSDTFSDAFDADFCKGEINNCYFSRTGNDAMDFSGSVINIKDSQMTDCGDKGISVGEESDVTVFDSQISGAPIGVASKDLSLLYLRNIRLANCDQGFVAFQKKSEFGGGRIIVEGYQAEDIRRLHAISAGSSLQLDQQLIE